MKRFLLLLTLMSISGIVFSQSYRFGIQGGLSLPSLQPKAPLDKGGDYQVSVRFLAGAYAEIKFEKFGIQPGLFIAQKGNQATRPANLINNGATVPYKIQQNINLTYLEIPVNGLYYHPSKFGTLYLGAGPYAAFAIRGNVKNKSIRNNYQKKVVNEEVSFGSENDQLKSSDFGVNVLGGIQLKNRMNLGANFGLGLTNLNNTDVKSYNRVFSLRVGYLF